MRSKRLSIVITLGLVGLILAPITTAYADDDVFINENKIEFTANDGQKTEAYQGFIMVPENRNNPDSRLIKVSYVRFPGSAEKTSAPIVYLAGGPGGSGIATAKWRRFPLFMAMREFGDVIALDQRGTGISEQAPECISKQMISHTRVISNIELTRKYRQAATECVDFWRNEGFDPLGYTTVQNAMDLEDLRLHLKAEQLSLWGISYGSHLALSAMKLFPERINKVIIASAEGLDQTVKMPSRTDAYFDRVQIVINQQPELAKQIPDIKALMKRVHAQLDQLPMNVKIPRKNKEPLDFLFQKWHLQSLASMMIADPGEYLSMLLKLYSSLDEKQDNILTAILGRGIFNDSRIKFKLMSMSMDVASGISKKRLMQVNQEAKTSLLGKMLNFPMPHLHKFYPELDLGDEFRTYPRSVIPTLLFTGTLDGRTYIKSQGEAVKGLSNLTHIRVENAGHNLFTISPEVLTTMQDFMKNEEISKTVIRLPTPNLMN